MSFIIFLVHLSMEVTFLCCVRASLVEFAARYENMFTTFPPELKSILLFFHFSGKFLSPCVTTLFSFSTSFLSASRCP